MRAPAGYVTYSLSYNNDAPVPHLTGITNHIQTAETYGFTYTSAALGPPFGTDPSYSGLTTAHLATMNVPAAGNYQFSYDGAGAGELDQVTFPYGGHLRWTYQNFQYFGGRTLREVNARYLAADSAGATEWGPYTLTRPDGWNSVAVHSRMTLTDASGNGAKTWNFVTSGSGWQVGLVADFAQKATAGSTTAITHDYYTWSQNAGGNPYVSAKTSVMDEGTGNQQAALTTQAQDAYGNATQSVLYPFNNSSTPLKTYNSTYLTDSVYLGNYIRNRLLSTTLTMGSTVKTLVQNYYDGKQASGQPYPTCGVGGWYPYTPYGYQAPTQEMDSSPEATFGNRALISGAVTPAKTTCPYYYSYGGLAGGTASAGTSMTASADASTNYAAPVSVTTQSYGQTIGYNSWLGVTQTTGLNGETLYLSYDTAGRPTSATSPYGAVTSYSYSAAGSYPSQQTRYGPDGMTRTTLDGLGRAIRVERGPTTGFTSVVDTGYAPCACSPLGKVQKVSAPYPSGQSAANWTVYGYDGIGRTVSAVQPDGASTTTYSYAGNQTTVTDPAGKWKSFTSDVPGNLVTVVEPDPANQPGGTLTTSYSYDWMNHLSGVTMPRGSTTQTRTFVYSDAGLLTSATNPENGTVFYYYNGDNTLQHKHDAKGQDTVYTYDWRKRVTQIQRLVNGAEDTCQRVNYSYDTNPLNNSYSQYSIGRLTTAQYNLCNAPAVPQAGGTSFAEMYSYHPAGAVTGKRLQVTRTEYNDDFPNAGPSTSLDVGYTYTTAGQVQTVTYPFGDYLSSQPTDTLTYGYDTMGRPVSLQDNNGLGQNGYINWVPGAQYDYASRMTALQHYSGSTRDPYGYEVDLSVKETRGYNVNSQLTSIGYGYNSVATTNVWSTPVVIQYVYSATQNNGQTVQSVDAVSGETISYQYDALKRLTSAGAAPLSGSGAAAWTENFQYDGFGNLTGKILNGNATATLTVNANNQLTNAIYDGNGNMTSGSGATLGYDEANRVASATETSGGTEYYGYAPDNKRIYRLKADGQTEEFTFYGAQGEKLGVYSLQIAQPTNAWPPSLAFVPLRNTVWFAGKAIWEGSGAVIADRLGSNRNLAYSPPSSAFYPYGEEVGATANDRLKFATYTRDAFTGLDYAQNRYYASTYARFNSPDPYQAVAKGANNPKVPSSWNRYVYVIGDPVNLIDPGGLYGYDPGYYNPTPGCDDDPYDAACGVDYSGTSREDNGQQGRQAGGGGGSSLPPCDPLPAIPSGIGPDQIQKNIDAAHSFFDFAIQSAATGESDPLLALAGYFIGKFAPGGPWDYKSQYPAGSTSQTQARDFGNFNFGAVLESFGFSYSLTQNAAGVAQIAICAGGGACGTGLPFFQYPFGDQTSDAAVIKKGYDYEKLKQAGCN